MPLTENIPKCMIKIKGKPIIKWIYDRLTSLNYIDNIYIITGYKEKVIKDYGKDNLLGCIYITQENITGTADAISLIKKDISHDFIVLAGDTIYNTIDLINLTKKENTLLYTRHNTKLREFGTIKFWSEDIIGNIYEKKLRPASNCVNISGYHLTREIFNYIDDTPKLRDEKPIPETINLMIDDGIEFRGVYIDKWYHISYKEDIERIEKEI